MVGRHGEELPFATGWNWRDHSLYLNQLEFMNDYILELTETIQTQDPDALIILQSDHGNRYAIHMRQLGEWDDYDPQVENPCMQNSLNCVYYRGKSFPIEGETGTVSSLVVGIGINLHPNPAWPEEVQAVAGAISDFGKPPRRAELAAAVLNHFEDVYALLDQGKEPELLEQYRERLCCIGRPVTVISPAGRYEAECVGLDENAHLLVKTADGQVNTLSSGEISIRL